MFDFSKLLDIKFLLETNPPAQFASRNLFLIVFGLIILLAVLIWLASKYLIRGSKTLSNLLEAKVFYLLLTLGIVGMILTLFRVAGASYLSMRLIFLLFLLAILTWAISLIFYLIVSFPKEYHEEIDQKRREKYLPKKR